ncbi:Peptidase M1, membrane alanine aminopeptidase [Syntrophobacter sp. SbD1]|nr:Peptidase M1, membrane alanine aminopeptidase [Syntrophobacter sp. SbD1]
MPDEKYRYLREDFGELPVQLQHLDIYLNFLSDRVEAVNYLRMIAVQELDRISLDARDLEILSVQWCSGPDSEESPLQYEYIAEQNKLVVMLPRKVPGGEIFSVRTRSFCYPSDYIFEGIYKDVTPPGAPQQYMSQCQQWGFQRIMPIFDDCRAKCTMRTTLEAEVAYTHLISNGDIETSSNPDGVPVRKSGQADRQTITFNNPIPMPPYLFIACAGTYDVLRDRVVYDDGRAVNLEYLVPPGQSSGAQIPMTILKKSVRWVKATQDYQYSGDTYRTICMGRSNFGGMENAGNTTIVTDAALVGEHTMDQFLLYAHAVIVHEFEHNQCGSETTMETPFDVWLNEAFTVDVERQFMADVFDPAVIRLNQVESIRNPLLGPLSIEDSGHAGRIVRQGFNEPDELIDGVTYVKAAEVIRMLRLLIGEENFKAGKGLYFSRYRFGNANTEQFFQCFEEVSGRRLDQFKEQWLYRIGYPVVHAKTSWDTEKKTFYISLHQEVEKGKSPFVVPIRLALVDIHGGDIAGTDQVFELGEPEARIAFENLQARPAFASINRDYSFYGTFVDRSANVESLIMQSRTDPNSYCRVDAMRMLTDIERKKLLDAGTGEIDPLWLGLYGEVLSDNSLPSALKAFFLRIDEQPMDRTYSAWFPELVRAREQLMISIHNLYRQELQEQFDRLDTYSLWSAQTLLDGIEDRQLKNVLLELLTAKDTTDSHMTILDHFRRATTANDKVSALLALNRSSAPERLDILEDVYGEWHSNISGYANYLRIIGSGTCKDVFEQIERERRRPTFQITQPTWCRALFLTMANNGKMIWNERGVNWIADRVIEFAPINYTNAARMLNSFQHVRKMRPNLQPLVIAALERIVGNVSEQTSPAVHRQARKYLG